MLYRWGPVLFPLVAGMQGMLMFEFGRLWFADWKLACLMQGTPNAFTYETEFGAGLWVASMQTVPVFDSMESPCRVVLFCCT